MDVRQAAAETLEQMRFQAKTAIPALTELLKEKNEDVRWAATQALGNIGTTAIPTLMELPKDKNGTVRRAAAEALGLIYPKAKTAIPALAELQENDAEIRLAAAVALGTITPTRK